MLQSKSIQILFAVFFCTNSLLFTNTTSINLYQQTNPEILKTVNLEDPSEKDALLVSACHLLEKHGLKQASISEIVWEAITSVEMITEILPRYHKTLTTFGYIALMHQCAKMTYDFDELQKKQLLIKFFDHYKDTFNKLNNIIKHSAFAEKKYLNLCGNLSAEAQATLNATNQKLYFNWSRLTGLNESNWALEIGPRVNQLCTLSWYTLPILLVSFIHQQAKLESCHYAKGKEVSNLKEKESMLLSKLKKTSDENKRKNTEEKLSQIKDQIKELEKEVKNNPKIVQKAYNSFKLQKITPKEINQLKKDYQPLLVQEKAEIEKLEKSLNPKSYWSEYVKESIDRKKLNLNQATDLYNKSISDNLNLPEHYHQLLQKYHSLKPPYRNSALEEFAFGIIMSFPAAKQLPEEAIYYIYYKPVTFFNTLIAHSSLGSITNLPALLYDTITHIPAGMNKGYELIQELHSNITKNLTENHDFKPNDTSTKLLAAGWTTGACAAITGIASLYPYMLYRRYHATKELFDIIYEKQKELVDLGHLLRSMQRVNSIIKKDPDLKKLIPENKTLSILFDSSSKKTSSDLKKLVNLLLSSSFQKGKAYYATQQGKVLATHHLFMRVKEKLVPFLQAYGQIDAYLSVYKLYSQYKDHEHAPICLPTFINQHTPQLVTQDFWHPLIDPNKVITNCLEIGTKPENANLVITGPNAGGKTTALMSLIITIIMAQSFGIAPAKNVTLTPFAKIHSYLDITTNLLEGESLFKAEVNRSKRLKESILSCQSGEKAFTIIDEIFSGTNPDVASKVGFSFADQIGNIPHSMSIITTHFPHLTDLEEETGRYENNKVADAHIAQDGRVTYPFKIEKGKSTQNIAQHMLEVEGII